MKNVSRLVRVMISDQFATTRPKRSTRRSRLGAFAVQQRDLFGILAHPHEIESEVGLVALLVEIESDQRPADQMGETGADQRIDQRSPHQIARDIPLGSEQM